MTRLVQGRFGGTEATACAMPRSNWLASSCVCDQGVSDSLLGIAWKPAGVVSYLDVE